MTRWIEVTQGVLLVNIDDEAAWNSVKLSFAFHGVRWKETPADSTETGALSFGEFLLIASTCPCDRHMDELAEAMGISPSIL